VFSHVCENVETPPRFAVTGAFTATMSDAFWYSTES
jgi:hypothetical protein